MAVQSGPHQGTQYGRTERGLRQSGQSMYAICVQFGQQVIVAFNRFASDTDEEVEAIRRHCEEKLEVGFAVNNAFAKGGEGAVDLANLVVDTIENKPSEPLTFTYEESDCVERKIEKVACNLYGASVVTYSLHSRKVIKLIEQMGISHYPVCIAKTQYSFSADPKIYGAVNNFEFPHQGYCGQ